MSRTLALVLLCAGTMVAGAVLAAGSPLARFLHEGTRSRLETALETLADRLPRWFEGTGYTGPVGIDALVWRDPGGALALHPLVEINPRRTLGRALLDGMRWHAGSGRAGRLTWEPGHRPAAPWVERDPAGGWRRAYLPLDGGRPDARWRPVWTVAPRVSEFDETERAARS